VTLLRPDRVARIVTEHRDVPPDPEVPTGVLLATAGPPDAAPYIDGWLARRVSRYAEWIRNRPHGTLIVATDAVHFVYREVPTLTTEVVRRVLAGAATP
jgi:pimeloyl-ACP methyl ester carboxylesterase